MASSEIFTDNSVFPNDSQILARNKFKIECTMEGSASECSLIMDESDSLSKLDVTWSGSTPALNSRTDPSRRRSASFMAVQAAVLQLTRMNDFVMEKISEGFFAEVYKVQHIVTGEEMVLKKNKQLKNSKQMLYEIQLMNRLSHPNILRYKGCCVHEGQLHALTEYMNAGTVEDWILSKAPMPWRLRVKIAIDVANGMSYLHSKGVFHRDLTSKNCLLHLEHDVLRTVVADFGLAADIQKYKLHRHNDIVGSPYWMAPECLYGKPYAEKADVFSYGIILAELMARIPADPEYMPRTNNFGMDFEKLRLLCVGSPEKLWQLMVQCCQMDPESRLMFSQAVIILESIDLSTSDNIIASTDLIQAIPEPSFKNTKRNSVSDTGRSSKDWRRLSSCSDPGDATLENKGDSGIDPGVFFTEPSKKRLSSSCGRLIAKMDEFTTFEELEAYLKSYTSSSIVSKEGANVEDTVPCSPSEHAKTTSPQFVTPSVCKTSKHLPDPTTPYAPPPTPCTSKIRPAVSLPSLNDTEMFPLQVASSQLSSPDMINPCIRRRRTDVKSNNPSTSPSSTVHEEPIHSARMSPELLLEHEFVGFSLDSTHTHDEKPFPFSLHPKQVNSPST